MRCFLILCEGFKWSRPEVYEAELYFKDKEVEELREEIRLLKKHSFGCERLTSVKLWEHYTGINQHMFELITLLCESLPITYYGDLHIRALQFKDQVLLTLMKLLVEQHVY
jgi:hypothetical protein